MKNIKLVKNKIAIIIIDMQDFFLKNFMKEIPPILIKNQLSVIDICISKKIPLIVLEYKCRGIFRGETTKQLNNKIKNIPHSKVLIKENNSGFTDTNLSEILGNIKCKKLLLMGVNANGCVQDTAISAIRKGYKVIVSKGVMASSGRKDMELSKRNENWYKENTMLFSNVGNLLKYLKRSL